MSEDTPLAVQIITRAIGATVSIVEIRNVVDGTTEFAVRLECGTARWLSTCRFQDQDQANIARIAIEDFVTRGRV